MSDEKTSAQKQNTGDAAPNWTDSDRVQIRNILQERTTSKWLWLRDSGYRKGLVMDAESCCTPPETWLSHHKPLLSSDWQLIQRLLLWDKQARVIDEMINIISDPLKLWKYATDGSN